jgi:hypothetical protein
MKNPAITVNYVLLADDVRTEDNGKMIVVGMYNDAIVLLEGGDTFVSPLTFLINASLPKDKGVHLTTWIEGPAGQRMQESDFGTVGPPPASDPDSLISWRILPWKSEGLGRYKLHMTQGGHDSVIREFVVRN